jgi:hypothetical protein
MNNETEQQKKTNIEEARARLAEKYQSAKIGGVGTMRRKHKAVHKPSMTDAKLEAVMKKFNTQPIPDIAEVNMFTTDAKVISFSKPTGTSILTPSPRLLPDADHDRHWKLDHQGAQELLRRDSDPTWSQAARALEEHRHPGLQSPRRNLRELYCQAKSQLRGRQRELSLILP